MTSVPVILPLRFHWQNSLIVDIPIVVPCPVFFRIRGSYRGILGSCLGFQFPVRINTLHMQRNIISRQP